MPEFVATGNGGARLMLDDIETGVIRQLTAEMRALLSGRRSDARDPVIDRLFPATFENAEDEAHYRDLIGDDLLTHKLKALDAVSMSLGKRSSKIPLDDEALDAWLACLTDLRLAIGTRLDVDEERMGAEIDPNDPDARSLAILHWLGWIQEGVLRACSGADSET